MRALAARGRYHRDRARAHGGTVVAISRTMMLAAAMIPVILVIVMVFTVAIAGWLPFGWFGSAIALALIAIVFLGLQRAVGDTA